MKASVDEQGNSLVRASPATCGVPVVNRALPGARAHPAEPVSQLGAQVSGSEPFPFSAIVGQEELKTAVLIAAFWSWETEVPASQLQFVHLRRCCQRCKSSGAADMVVIQLSPASFAVNAMHARMPVR